MPTTIESYLVGLGFSVNQGELRKFQEVLALAGKAAENVTAGFVTNILKWQIAVTGAFAGIATSLIGLADHVAEQDQEFRLLGLRMMMSTEHAKSLKVAMDALGQPLEVIAWDPEIHGRFLQLIEDQKQLQAGLGNGQDFETQMRMIRDVRFEFTRLRVELQYLGAALVSKLFASFGASIDSVLKKLREWNDLIIGHLPELTEQFAKYLIPIINETAIVFNDLWAAMKEFAILFTSIMGLLSGDTSLASTEFSFDRLSKAVQITLGFMADFLRIITNIEAAIAHLANGISLGLAGKFSAMGKELAAFDSILNPLTFKPVGEDVLGQGTGPSSAMARGIRNNNPGNIEYGAFARREGATGREAQGRFATFATEVAGLSALADLLREYGAQGNDTVRGILSKYSPAGENGSANTSAYITNVAKSLGVNDTAHLNMSDPRIMGGLMNAIIRQENGKNPYSSEQIANAAGGGMTVGDVHVHVTNPNASAQDIGNTVKRTLQTMRNNEYARASAQYAY